MRKQNIMKYLNVCEENLKNIKRLVNGASKNEPFDNLELPKQLELVRKDLKNLERLIE